MLRSSEAAESVVVDLIDPKFHAFSIVCVDLEGGGVDRLLRKIFSSLVGVHMVDGRQSIYLLW